ncbi:MAG TPA: RsmB/NOP family class I SAM-dependent RNA methyltransferase, partial [Anseongella sp.]|nr:RsmB/NOP family class I SAM-dependent RNA methyltransferase [Anseongella sp.]
MRFPHYLRTAGQILGEYKFQTPLPGFLRNYFRRDRRMGSTDRRTVSSLVYSYFRTGNLLRQLPPEERLQAAWFLCHEESTALLDYFRPEWDRMAGAPPAAKLEVLGRTFGPLDLLDIFPLHQQLSPGIDAAGYALSMLSQPRLFIRIKEAAAGAIKEKLRAEAIVFEELSSTSLAFDNSTRVDQALEGFRGSFEVQDLSSQLTGSYFQAGEGESWWDACAGSGGKSLMLNSLEPTVKLYVSDNRASILKNLEERFGAAGIRDYQMLLTDLLTEALPWVPGQFDGIILDTPCSGSGTWGRSPEMMAAFEESGIQTYCRLQKAIAGTVIPFLKPGKPLVYIT